MPRRSIHHTGLRDTALVPIGGLAVTDRSNSGPNHLDLREVNDRQSSQCLAPFCKDVAAKWLYFSRYPDNHRSSSSRQIALNPQVVEVPREISWGVESNRGVTASYQSTTVASVPIMNRVCSLDDTYRYGLARPGVYRGVRRGGAIGSLQGSAGSIMRHMETSPLVGQEGH